jgi:hypothetical protein
MPRPGRFANRAIAQVQQAGERKVTGEGHSSVLSCDQLLLRWQPSWA